MVGTLKFRKMRKKLMYNNVNSTLIIILAANALLILYRRFNIGLIKSNCEILSIIISKKTEVNAVKNLFSFSVPVMNDNNIVSKPFTRL